MKKQEYIKPQLDVVDIPGQSALMAVTIITEGKNYYQQDPDYEIEDEDDFG